jgi:hypothetical protein
MKILGDAPIGITPEQQLQLQKIHAQLNVSRQENINLNSVLGHSTK